MAFKSDTLPTGRMAFAKRGKEPPYVNLEPKSSGKTPQAKSKCSPPPAKSKTNREYERLATALVEKGREGSPRGALPPIDGVRFRDCTKAKQRVGLAALDYEAQKQGELTLKHGSMMEIVAEEYGQEGWALARVDTLGRGDGTRVGIVPKHYLALMGSQPEIVDRESVQRSADFLGSGAYAEVFRGTHKGKQVALKLARSECDEALKREALILSRLCHENIVQFFGMSLDPVFIVLELCEVFGGTLNSIYRQMESSDVLTVFFWAKQVASALEHLHGRNEPLVYADLKAANVLVKQKPCACGLEDGTWKAKDDAGRADGQCQNEKCRGRRIDRLTLKLADFNVSRYAGEKRDSCSGSMPWKAPDLMKNGAISHPKMDVWSFGMFIYELLTRKLPDFDVIIYWMSFIQRGNPLPLPDDLPEAIREIFVGCWQWENEKRPTIAEVKMELEKAEKSVESNYKWKLDTEKQQKKGAQSEGAAAEAVAALEQLQQQKPLMFNISEQMVQLYLERVYKKSCKKPTKMERMWAAWFQPPDPKRQKRPMKLDKQSIGTPIGFRHVVSGKVCERADNPCDKPKVKLYANAELAPLQRQQSHRSHESLLECVGGSSDKNGKNAVGYSTLPRTFRVHQSQQQNMSSDAHLLLPPPVPPKSSCCRVHPCCAKKLGGLVKIKAAKSNPELNNLGTKSGGGGGAKVFPMAMGGMGNGDGRYHQIRHQSPQPISRPHDYLSLLPNSAIFRQQHQHNQHQQMDKCQRLTRPLPTVVVPPDSSVGPEEDCPLRKDRAEPDWAEADGAPSAFCNDNNELEIGRRQYVNLPHSVQKAARRTNAVRQRMVAEATGISPESSDCSSSVTTPNGAGGCASEMPSVTTRDGNAREDGTSGTGGIDSLPELLNRRVSPPHHRHHHHSLSPSTALSGGSGASIQLRRATCGELDKSRRGELGHSTFYVDEPDSPSTEGANASHSLAATPSSDEMGSGGRRRSAAGSGGVHRSIASLLFKPLIGAKTSPRGSDQQVEPDTAVGMASGGITVACCFHPHHGAVVPHLCALSSMFVPECQLGPASDQLSTRPIDIVSESAGHVTVQRNAQHNPKFIKRADYPENQARQRHRTESAATAAAQQSHRRTYHNSSNGGGKCFTPAITEPSRQRRVSSSVMDTVIEMPQCVSRSSAIGGASSAFLRAQSPRGSSSSSILNTTIPLHAHNISSSTLLLSPDHAALPHWHQRSHSSDSPAGKPLSSNDLAELLRRHPVPIDGSIANPSYVPMKENAKNVKLVVPTTKSVHSSPQAPSFSAQKQEERPKRPVPMPRREGTKKIEGRKEDNSAQCPTSQAPVLNRAEMVTSENLSMALNDFSMPVSEQRRPTTLRLGPPPLPPCAVPPPTTVSVSLSGCASDSFGHNSANAVANSSQNGGGWDSGMCASSSNEGDDCSPQTFAPPKGVVACCSATVFPAGAHQSTVVPEPPSECAHRHFRLPSSVNVSHHFFSSPPFPPPPVPPKLHKDKEGPRVPPLPRNRRMMKQ